MRLWIIFVLGSLTIGQACAAQVVLALSGNEFNGGPAFSLLVGSSVVGTGVVDPIPKSSDGAQFAFDVDDALLATGAPIAVKLTNDAYEEGVGDRNLIVLGATVDGTALTQSDFAIFREDGTETGRRNGMLSSNRLFAVAEPPTGSWIAVAQDAEQAGGLRTNAVAATEQQQPLDTDKLATETEPKTVAALVHGDDEPAPEPGQPADSAEATEPQPEPHMQQPAEEACDTRAEVAGYGNGMIDLTSAQKAELGSIVSRANSGSCSVLITGYSSTSGPEDLNRSMAGKRAEFVLSYLRSEGLSFTETNIVAAGETTQFGPAQADNRRVIVELAP